MINTLLQLSTPVLIVGGLACSTVIPAIEAALRAIVGTGQLLHNRCQYAFAKVAFRPEKSFTTSPEYKIGQECLMKHIEVIEKSKNLESCMYDVKKSNSKLKLQFGNQSFEVDREMFKNYSTQYKELAQDFDAFNDKIGSDADNQIHPCIVPETFTEKSFELLTSYLTNKTLFNEQSPELRKLDLEKLINLYKLADYLHIPDLEARCVRIIKGYIDEGRIDIDQFDNALKDGKYNEKYHIEDESFRKMLVDIKNFKKDYYNKELKNRINLLDLKKDSITKKILEQTTFAAALIFASMVPIAGPALMHLMQWRHEISDAPYSLSVFNVIIFSLGLGACTMGAVMLTSVTVYKVSQFVVAALSAPISERQLIMLFLILLLNRR